MNEFLTQHFLSLKWDKNYASQLNASLSEDTIVSKLDSILPEWHAEITHMTDSKVAIALYLPGKIYSGIGTSDVNAICNIIRRINPIVNTESLETPTQQSKATIESVTAQLTQMKTNAAKMVNTQDEITKFDDAEVIDKPKTNNILDDLLMMNESTKPTSPAPQEPIVTEEPKEEALEFGTPECDAYEKEFWDSVNGSSPVPNTPEGMNPNMEYMIPRWTEEQGMKLKAWANEHNISNKDEMSAWLKKYCGLEYDYFNPMYVDNFITWTNVLREKQTY